MYGFDYQRPASRDAAKTAASSADARYLAGGQSLIQAMRLRLSQSERLVDLGGIADLKAIKVEALVTGAIADHLTPWAACYRTTQLLGGKSTFVLSNAGHVASLVNPPGNAKATYYLGAESGPDPEAWRKRATQHTGTWWEVWADWIAKRSGAEVAAPATLGGEGYPVLGPAPGEYVRQPA